MTHRSGRPQGNSDALSRIACEVCQRQEQNESKDTNDHNPGLHNEETVSINMTTVELSSAVTQGQQQSDASAQLKSHARIQEFSSGGRGGPGQSDKKTLTTFFLVLSLFYRSQMVNFKEIYHFLRSQRWFNIFKGGGGPIAYSL